MRWIAMVLLALFLSSCGTLCNTGTVSNCMDPAPPTFVIADDAFIDVTTTEVDYY